MFVNSVIPLLKTIMQRALLILFLVFHFTIAFSQDTTNAYSLHQYTTENGLPSNLVRGIQWDNSTNFLWIVTEGGIVRFNGVEFKSYNKEKISPIVPQKNVYAVKNNTGNIFISDGSGNIYAIQQNKPFLSKPSSLSNSFINYHFISVSDAFFNAKIKAPPVFPASFEKVISLSDTACIILYQNSVYSYSLKMNAPAELNIKKGHISSIFKIDNNYFFADDNQQVFLLDTKTFTADEISFVAEDKDLLNFKTSFSQLFWQTGMNNPIIVRANKAWLLNYTDKRITAKLISNIIPTDANISTVEYAMQNNLLFIGTESKGIIIISKNLVEPKKRRNANPKNKNAYFSQVLLNNGNILTNEGDIIGNSDVPPGLLPITGKFATRISSTNNGNVIWYNSNDAKTPNCLHQFNKATGLTTNFEKIKINTQVVISGDTTYAANNNGIGIIQGDSIYYLYEYPKNATGLYTYDFKEITPGILAAAGCSGLLRFTIATKKIDTIYSKPNACFGSIWKYKDYIFWSSYGFGYFIYKNGVVKEMPIDKNEYLLYCHCFVLDPYGFCWISTNRGI